MPTRRLRRRVILAATSTSLALSLLPGVATGQAPLEPVPCTAPSADGSGADGSMFPKGSACGTLSVPLDHSGATPGRVGIDLAVVPARGQRRGTLVILSGGPGQAAIPLTAVLSARLARVGRTHDLVFLDQRGTGGSDAVRCREVASPQGVERCAQALGPRRPFWTTKETALDLEDVRVALGAEKLSLLGISYGTKVAGEYSRRFPARTERLVLDSPAPTDGLDAPFVLRQIGLPRVLSEVCSPGCETFLSDPGLALRTLVGRLARRPLRGRAVLPSGRTRSARVTQDDLYALVGASDLDPFLRTELPAAIASGVLGDAAPLLRLLTAAGSQAVPDEVNVARLLATGCVEGRLPWAPDSPVAGRDEALAAAFAGAARAFAPFDRETVLRATLVAPCAAWPPTPRPEGVPTLGPDVPVLILSGREDLRTPLEDARRTAAQYPNATILTVSGVGHSVLGADEFGCSSTGVAAFFAGAPVMRCTTRQALAPSPFVPAALGDLAPQRGVPGAAGRVATAVRLTLLDASLVIIPGQRVPGLRGGSARPSADEDRVSLRDFEFVRGAA